MQYSEGVNVAGSARQIYLGQQLRDLRRSAGLSLDDVAERLERNRTTIGHWERGATRVSAQDLEALLTMYEVSEELAEQLRELRRDSHKRGWWHSYKLPSFVKPFLSFESEAVEVFNFELGTIPGLLQTEEYARATHESGRLELSDEELREWVEARIRRQARLDPGGGLTLHTVIAEEALRRVVGSPDLMVRQIEYLEEMSKKSSVNLRVLPFKHGSHVGIHGPIMVLRSSDPHHGEVAYSDTPLGGHIIDDSRDVAELSRLYSSLEAQALPHTASYRMLRTIARDHVSAKE
ncbi:hypothetical protein CDG81_09740 [Actinopolyspora erythraea]|uniref:HTH cro/C1-type domain-containing protein n=1 Tax=Actinopolyspora erythraea TaxID=414996 RepID=A0A223RRM0_9ACTN|nr:helix-turn-helix transcriptional regulator [Actinopolyspora erythraea]ASU78516.1 hypothetical protein CDG81_09740 [Actinopolyspora erythraea]